MLTLGSFLSFRRHGKQYPSWDETSLKEEEEADATSRPAGQAANVPMPVLFTHLQFPSRSAGPSGAGSRGAGQESSSDLPVLRMEVAGDPKSESPPVLSYRGETPQVFHMWQVILPVPEQEETRTNSHGDPSVPMSDL